MAAGHPDVEAALTAGPIAGEVQPLPVGGERRRELVVDGVQLGERARLGPCIAHATGDAQVAVARIACSCQQERVAVDRDGGLIANERFASNGAQRLGRSPEDVSYLGLLGRRADAVVVRVERPSIDVEPPPRRDDAAGERAECEGGQDEA